MNKLFWDVKTLEELGEVSTAICKIMNYGNTNSGYSNIKDLQEEIGDLLYCLDKLIEVRGLSIAQIANAYDKKAKKIEEYSGKSLLYVDETAEEMKSAMRLQAVND